MTYLNSVSMISKLDLGSIGGSIERCSVSSLSSNSQICCNDIGCLVLYDRQKKRSSDSMVSLRKMVTITMASTGGTFE